MGQCSTLPVDTKSPTKSTSSRKKLDKTSSSRRSSSDYRASDMKKSRSSKSARYTPFGGNEMKSDQFREPSNSIVSSTESDGFDIDMREAPFEIPLPPEIAERVRCYKLNLDADFSKVSPTEKQSMYMGPFVETPPALTYTTSEDSAANNLDSVQIAIKTAQIFRGITVNSNGVILTQNARAMRSNQGKKNKKGEKSRQATKIEQSSELVEETIATGKAPNSDTPARLESLYVMGEYDDMKYLVKDGSRKIRDAEGQSDSSLTCVNQFRVVPGAPVDRRASHPLTAHSHMNNKFCSGDKTAHGMLTPPRLKSNPKDTRSSRRFDCRQEDNWGLLWSCGAPTSSSPIRNEDREGRSQRRESGATTRF